MLSDVQIGNHVLTHLLLLDFNISDATAYFTANKNMGSLLDGADCKLPPL